MMRLAPLRLSRRASGVDICDRRGTFLLCWPDQSPCLQQPSRCGNDDRSSLVAARMLPGPKRLPGVVGGIR